MLPFPNRCSPTFLHVPESQREAEIPYRGRACTLQQRSGLGSTCFSSCVLLAQGLIPAPGSRVKGCPAQGARSLLREQSPACPSLLRWGIKTAKAERKMPLGAENTGSGRDGQAVIHNRDTHTPHERSWLEPDFYQLFISQERST